MKKLTLLLPRVTLPAVPGVVRMAQLNPLGYQIQTMGVDAHPSPPEALLCDHFESIGPHTEERLLEHLSALCHSHSVDLILPAMDDHALLCARQRAAFEALGTRVLAPPAESIEPVIDKSRLFALLQERGMEEILPPWHSVSSVEELERGAQALGYPDRTLVAKPQHSCGRRGVIRICAESDPRIFYERREVSLTLDEYVQRYHSLPHPPKLLMMQELPGKEYSADGIFFGERAEFILRERLQVYGGVAWASRPLSHPFLEGVCAELARQLGLVGLSGFQFKEDEEGRPYLLECNPRIQGTLVATLAAGKNLLWKAICGTMGWPLPEETPPQYGATYSRTWEGVIYLT